MLQMRTYLQRSWSTLKQITTYFIRYWIRIRKSSSMEIPLIIVLSHCRFSSSRQTSSSWRAISTLIREHLKNNSKRWPPSNVLPQKTNGKLHFFVIRVKRYQKYPDLCQVTTNWIRKGTICGIHWSSKRRSFLSTNRITNKPHYIKIST